MLVYQRVVCEFIRNCFKMLWLANFINDWLWELSYENCVLGRIPVEDHHCVWSYSWKRCLTWSKVLGHCSSQILGGLWVQSSLFTCLLVWSFLDLLRPKSVSLGVRELLSMTRYLQQTLQVGLQLPCARHGDWKVRRKGSWRSKTAGEIETLLKNVSGTFLGTGILSLWLGDGSQPRLFSAFLHPGLNIQRQEKVLDKIGILIWINHDNSRQVAWMWTKAVSG